MVACPTSKIAYARKGDAIEVLTRIRGRRGKKGARRPIVVYQCKQCGSWHVGGAS